MMLWTALEHVDQIDRKLQKKFSQQNTISFHRPMDSFYSPHNYTGSESPLLNPVGVLYKVILVIKFEILGHAIKGLGAR